MHPYLIEQLAEERHRELLRSAEAWRLAHPVQMPTPKRTASAPMSDTATYPMPEWAPDPSETPTKPRSQLQMAGIAVVAFVVVLALVATGSGVLTRTSGVGVSGVPPAGVIWFGTAADPGTFEVSGRTDTTRVGSSVAIVAHLTRAVGVGDVNARISLNGTLVSNTALSLTDGGDLIESTTSPLVLAGFYRYEFTDLGGRVLAAGSITATP